jgi:hypothetical protein
MHECNGTGRSKIKCPADGLERNGWAEISFFDQARKCEAGFYLLPAAFHEYVSVTTMLPSRCDPDSMFAGRLLPLAGNPDIPVAVPPVISTDPYVVTVWSGRTLLNL